MARLIQRLLTVFRLAAVMAAVMAAGNGGFAAGKSTHTCDEMAAGMTMDNCPDGAADVMTGCAVFLCGAQIVPPTIATFFVPIMQTRTFAPPLHDDLVMCGLSGRPDLRPPIV